MVRSTVFQVMTDDALYPKVRESVRLYRAAARQVYCACAMAEMAGAEIVYKNDIVAVNPHTDEARAILAKALGKDGAAHLYQCRDWVLKELAPTWHSFVWDSLRRHVSSAWRAPDTQFANAKRGYLTLQGARDIARFRHLGIGMPASAARPKLHEHKLTVAWDHAIGPVEFTLPRLDGGRYVTWKCLRDHADGWKLGTIYLSERDGKLSIIVSHERPDKP